MSDRCNFCEGLGWLVAIGLNGSGVRVPCTECCGGMGVPASADDHLSVQVVFPRRKPELRKEQVA